jgi:glycosyltransferase involved in cell wall biosynthesis
MNSLSVVIITKDEEENIRRCLDSVRWADEIIVVDTGSTDSTKEIAEESGASVYKTQWQGFGQAKAFAVEKTSGDWVLSVDADEEITVQLAKEIREAIETEDGTAGFIIPRKTNFLGRWINHSRWSPDYVLRLFRRRKGRFSSSLVHEEILVEGRTARLRNHILHRSYPNAGTYFDKLERYSTLGAEEMYKKGKKSSALDKLLKPAAAFYRHYIFGAGFLDGLEGFLIAILSAYGVITKYRKLALLKKSKGND